MRPVYMIGGGVTKFAKAHPDKDFRLMVKEAYDYALRDVPRFSKNMIDGAVGSYFSDHFTRQLKAASMVQDYLGLCPKPSKRIEGGGATGGLCFQSAWEAVASGRMHCCLAFGFETMSRVNTWKGNEFIALASDTNFDFPVGGFYTGYYAMMVRRHMHEFGTTVEQMAMVSVKNHANAMYNPYAQKARRLTVKQVRESPMVATPLTMEDICTMSDGAAVCVLASEELAAKVCDRPVKITGVGSGSDAMRMADRPHGKVILLPHERESDYTHLKYPGVHSFRGGRMAAKLAYEMAGITDPRRDIHVVEPYDPFAYKELHHLEGLLLADKGQAPRLVEQGFWDRDTETGIPASPSGGLLGVGNPIAAAGLMKLAEIYWQLQGEAGPRQVKREVRRGLAQGWGDLMQVGTVVIMGK